MRRCLTTGSYGELFSVGDSLLSDSQHTHRASHMCHLCWYLMVGMSLMPVLQQPVCNPLSFLRLCLMVTSDPPEGSTVPKTTPTDTPQSRHQPQAAFPGKLTNENCLEFHNPPKQLPELKKHIYSFIIRYYNQFGGLSSAGEAEAREW